MSNIPYSLCAALTGLLRRYRVAKLTGSFRRLPRANTRYRRYRLALVAAATLLLLPPSTSHTVGMIAGDLAPRGAPDGVINAADLLILQRIVQNQIVPTAAEILVGDVAPLGNPDGKLDAGDLVLLQRAINGSVTLPDLADNQAPLPADVSLIAVVESGSGQIQVTGSVEANATVTLVNYETGATAATIAGSDGSFATNLIADAGQVFGVVVTDAAGNSSSSVGVGVGQILTLNVMSPPSGSVVNDDVIRITGSYTGPPGTAVTVNGQVACTSGGAFYADNIFLEPGENTVRVSAAIADGVRLDETLTVTSVAASPVKVLADSPCGFAPHQVNFLTTSENGIDVQQVDADFDGDGTVDASASGPDFDLSHIYALPGVYQAQFTVYDQLGVEYSATQTIVVSEIAVTNGILRNVYNSMLNRLTAGAIDGALNHLTPIMQGKYRSVFEALGPDLPAVVNQLGTLAGGRIGDALAMFTVVRGENGVQMGFPVTLVRGNDGVWRIDEM